jgi:hypothetical protein
MVSLFLPEQRGAGEDLKMEIIPLCQGGCSFTKKLGSITTRSEKVKDFAEKCQAKMARKISKALSRMARTVRISRIRLILFPS